MSRIKEILRIPNVREDAQLLRDGVVAAAKSKWYIAPLLITATGAALTAFLVSSPLSATAYLTYAIIAGSIGGIELMRAAYANANRELDMAHAENVQSHDRLADRDLLPGHKRIPSRN